MNRRRLVLAGVGLLAPLGAAAEGKRSYAVISLIGDELNIVSYERSIRSHVDSNRRESLPTGDVVFDRTVLATAGAELKKVDASAQVALFMPRAPELFKGHDRFFDGSKATLPNAIGAELQAQGITHLVLFTKHRGEAMARGAFGRNMAHGKLEGLGFYIDRSPTMRDLETNERSQGFLAPYVYVRASLIDLADGKVLQSRLLIATQMTLASASKDRHHPWEAMDAKQKVDTLSEMLEDQVREAVPALLVKP